MADFGYLIHTSIDEHHGQTVDAIFRPVSGNHVVIEQTWTPGEAKRLDFEKMVFKLRPDDTLYLSSIDCLGLDA